MTLKEFLNDWVNEDVCLFFIGVTLGLWPNTMLIFAKEVKDLLNSNNSVRKRLHDILDQLNVWDLVEVKNHKIRWNAKSVEIFRG